MLYKYPTQTVTSPPQPPEDGLWWDKYENATNGTNRKGSLRYTNRDRNPSRFYLVAPGEAGSYK